MEQILPSKATPHEFRHRSWRSSWRFWLEHTDGRTVILSTLGIEPRSPEPLNHVVSLTKLPCSSGSSLMERSGPGESLRLLLEAQASGPSAGWTSEDLQVTSLGHRDKQPVTFQRTHNSMQWDVYRTSFEYALWRPFRISVLPIDMSEYILKMGALEREFES